MIKVDRIITPVELLFTLGFAGSKKEAKRLIDQGAIKFNNQAISQTDKVLIVGKRFICAHLLDENEQLYQCGSGEKYYLT